MMKRTQPGQRTRHSMEFHNLRLRLQPRLSQQGLPLHIDRMRTQACTSKQLGTLWLLKSFSRSFTFKTQKEEAGESSQWAYFCLSTTGKNLTESTVWRNLEFKLMLYLHTMLRANHISTPPRLCAILLSLSALLNQPTTSRLPS